MLIIIIGSLPPFTFNTQRAYVRQESPLRESVLGTVIEVTWCLPGTRYSDSKLDGNRVMKEEFSLHISPHSHLRHFGVNAHQEGGPYGSLPWPCWPVGMAPWQPAFFGGALNWTPPGGGQPL